MPALHKLASPPLRLFPNLCPHDPLFFLLRVLASTLDALLFLRPELQKTGYPLGESVINRRSAGPDSD